MFVTSDTVNEEKRRKQGPFSLSSGEEKESLAQEFISTYKKVNSTKEGSLNYIQMNS